MNGTYVGKHLGSFNQDAFLGMPFALPPTGERRFQRPHYIDQAFSETRNATSYGPAVSGMQNYHLEETLRNSPLSSARNTPHRMYLGTIFPRTV